jgi:hypothetical protein
VQRRVGQPKHQLDAVVGQALLNQRTLVAVGLPDLQGEEDEGNHHGQPADEAADRRKVRK